MTIPEHVVNESFYHWRLTSLLSTGILLEWKPPSFAQMFPTEIRYFILGLKSSTGF